MHDPPNSRGRASLPTPGGGTTSFWHREPSSVLLGHRTTETLPSSADIVIIGSGISGAFAAWHLRKLRSMHRVVMLDAREACWGATGRNGGHCQPKLYKNSPHIGRFELENYRFIRGLVEDERIDCEWRNVTACHAYYDEALFYSAVAAAEALKALDPDLGRLVQVVTKRTPLPPSFQCNDTPSMNELRLSETAIGAVVTFSAASLWPYKLISWILETILKSHCQEGQAKKEVHSFNLQTNTPVTRLQKMDGGGWIVHTSRGMISTNQVLLATNAYTSFLLPQFSKLIVPVKEEMTALKPAPNLIPGGGIPLASRNSYCFYSSSKSTIMKDDYLVQRPFALNNSGNVNGGQLMFGGGREFARNAGVGISDDSFTEKQPVEYLKAALGRELDLQNGGESLEAECAWSGIMGFSMDHYPWVGTVPDALGGGDGLVICAGFSGHGMPNASLCAKAAVKAMMGEELNENDLPTEFVVSMERAEAAKRLRNVTR